MSSLADRITKPPGAGDQPAGENGSSSAAALADDVAKLGVDEAPQAGGGINESTYEVEVKLSDLNDPNAPSPLRSINSFDDLELKKPLTEGLLTMAYKKPSKIQERSLPLLLSDPPRNMIAQSQSGTGKTAAFVITMLQRIDFNNPRPQALCLAPSRELARQIEGVINQIGRFCIGLKVEAAVPGAVSRETGVQGNIVVGTPGTVIDSIRRRQFDTRGLKVLVVDEADNMLEQQGMGEQSMRVRAMIPQDVQVLLFSATFPDQVMQFAEKYAPSANQLRLRQQDLTVKGIKQMFMDCPSNMAKYDVLAKLYGLMTIGSSVIFVKTRESAETIQKRMEQDGHRISALHGAFDGNARDELLQDFRSGKSKVLITTNVFARGIDVSTVSMVINYDIPWKGAREVEPDMETYLHRIGRTGRFGRVGVSITFVSDQNSFNALTKIATHYGIELVQLSPEDWDDTEEQIKAVTKDAKADPNYKGEV